MVEVSIVIPAYGGKEFEDCLQMVYKQEVNFPFEVIVIDYSGCTQGTLDFLKDYPVRHKRISPTEFNHGLSRNMGIELARGRYVVVMTADAIPADRHWLRNILGSFQDDSVAGVYVRQIPREDADVLTKERLNNWLTGRQSRALSFIESWDEYDALEPLERYMLCNFDDVCSCLSLLILTRFHF